MAKETSKKLNVGTSYKVLVEPWITEAATLMAEMNKYVFKVNPKASKNQIKKAIEEVYGVKVEKINTVTIPRKKRVRGRTEGWKPGHKKAVVTIKEGDKIDLFESK